MKVTYIDHMGTDLSVVNAAKVSFGERSEWENGPQPLITAYGYDEEGRSMFYKIPDPDFVGKLSEKGQGLIQFLARGCTSGDWASLKRDVTIGNDPSVFDHIRKMPSHWSPFAHTAISLHLKMPIFVARQIMKHTTGIEYNEVSRRYVDSEPEFYVPDVWRKKADNVKQGSSEEAQEAPQFCEGFCRNCGIKLVQMVRKQGGGQRKKYCSDTCKYSFANRNRDPYKHIFNNAKARVKREGKRNWSLVHEDMEYPLYCPYLGLKLDYSIGKGTIQDNSPSFDRKDSSKDYTPENVEVVSHLANSMKNSASVDQQVKMAKEVLLRHLGYCVEDNRTYEGVCRKACDVYNSMVEEGYPAEQARMVLPQSMYTEVIATGNLYAWANLYIQRSDSHAQKETQDLAKQIGDIVKPLYPVSWEALTA